MTTIHYALGPNSDGIIWAASEIVQLKDLSTTAKILLSAVAGALIQHLLDQGYPANQIFQTGSFQVE